MRQRQVATTRDSLDLIAISLIAVNELAQRYTDELELAAVEDAMDAHAALRRLQDRAEVGHAMRYSATG